MAISLTSQESHFAFGDSAGFLFQMIPNGRRTTHTTSAPCEGDSTLYAREPVESISAVSHLVFSEVYNFRSPRLRSGYRIKEAAPGCAIPGHPHGTGPHMASRHLANWTIGATLESIAPCDHVAAPP